MKTRLLDLFCCAGGAAMGYHRAGFEVVGVDIKPQPHYPFSFLQMDALEAMDRLLRGEGLTFSNGETLYLKDFATFHASPPCQQFTAMQSVAKSKDKWPNLIPPIRERLKYTSRPFVIENVSGAPLEGHLMLCGSMFGLNTPRHRFFEASFMPLTLFQKCRHNGMYSKWRFQTHPEWCIDEKTKFAAAMGIDWTMSRQEVREAIPPTYTEYIGKYLMQAVLAGVKL